MKKIYLILILFSGLGVFTAFNGRPAGDDAFCKALLTITEASMEYPAFGSIKGSTTDSGPNITAWNCKVVLPGTDSARIIEFISSRYYKASITNTINKDQAEESYKKFKAALSACLVLNSFIVTEYNGDSGSETKKIVYQQTGKTESKSKYRGTHMQAVELELRHMKSDGKYKVTVMINSRAK